MFKLSEEAREALLRAAEALNRLFDSFMEALMPTLEEVKDIVKMLAEATLRAKLRRAWIRRKTIGHLHKILLCIIPARVRWHVAATGE